MSNKRYSVEALEAALDKNGVSVKALRLSGTRMKEFREHGVPEEWADRLACKRLGCHPAAVWHDWFDAVEPDDVDDGPVSVGSVVEGSPVGQLTLPVAAA